MLEVFINLICAFLMAIDGYYIITKIMDRKEKFSLKTILYLLINSIVITIIHYRDYQTAFILNFTINILTYKVILKNNINESIIGTSMMMLLIVLSDMILLPFLSSITSIQVLENNILVFLISNVLVLFISIIIINIKWINKLLEKYYNILTKYNIHLNIFFIIIMIIGISGSIINIFNNNKLNINLVGDIIITISLIVIGIIFIITREKYQKLENQYDNLNEYIKNFEDWIEKEQFIRHEYKNQLAVIYSLSSEKNVKDKIQEILNNNMNIDDKMVYKLRVLPKGGLKGLLYYKTIIAKKNKINLTIDVSINEKGILNKLSKKKMNELTKIIGIFYDNAIEASAETRKKNLMIEIYELKDKVNIVISNTFKKNNVVENRFGKGISTKGKGRGNGLYFAHKILNENKWIIEKQEIIDNYYVETLSIIKNTSKK